MAGILFEGLGIGNKWKAMVLRGAKKRAMVVTSDVRRDVLRMSYKKFPSFHKRDFLNVLFKLRQCGCLLSTKAFRLHENC